MTRDELEHAIRAACDLTQDTEVFVFGSQSILGQYPDAAAALRQSIEVDLAPAHATDKVDLIDGALGEDSPFHRAHGFYVYGVPIETAVLPAGWDARTVNVQNANTRNCTGRCVEAHDIAASKLAAFREKDRDFVRVLLREKLVTPRKLIGRLKRLPRLRDERERLITWVEHTVRELEPGRSPLG